MGIDSTLAMTLLVFCTVYCIRTYTSNAQKTTPPPQAAPTNQTIKSLLPVITVTIPMMAAIAVSGHYATKSVSPAAPLDLPYYQAAAAASRTLSFVLVFCALTLAMVNLGRALQSDVQTTVPSARSTVKPLLPISALIILATASSALSDYYFKKTMMPPAPPKTILILQASGI